MRMPGRPPWLDKKLDFRAMHRTERALEGLSLHTVCHQARCPNISECFARGTATFLIMGDICTRGCAFCGVNRGTPGPVDPGEPERLVEAVRRMGIRHVVVTSVTRDDLVDGGAGVFARVIRALRAFSGSLTIEVLVPDFGGDEGALCAVLDEGPDILGHNIETVPSLYAARKKCDYNRSLGLLDFAKKRYGSVRTKSALMLGLGETGAEVMEVFRDLRGVRCDYLSIGQYLQPGRGNLPVKEYVLPAMFEDYREKAMDLGFLHVESGVYVRSSYMADAYGTAIGCAKSNGGTEIIIRDEPDVEYHKGI